MGNVIIRCDTGFVGAVHEEDTGMTIEEWQALPEEGKNEWLKGIIEDNICSYAIDEDTEELID